MTRPDLRALADVFLAGSITIDSTLHWSGVDAACNLGSHATRAAALSKMADELEADK